jgi:hypothetical protein
MKRTLLAAATASLFALAIPGVASAHHGKGRHHHASAHKRHAKGASLVTFGTMTAPPASTPTTTTPTAPSGEPAGKVTSFEKGVLIITLTNGTAVSGLVNEQTELECHSATPPSTGGDDQGGGDDEAGSGEHGGPSPQGEAARDHGQGNQGGEGDEGNQQGGEGDGQSQSSCTTAALVPGTVVGAAELKLGGAGAVWEKVELLQ